MTEQLTVSQLIAKLQIFSDFYGPDTPVVTDQAGSLDVYPYVSGAPNSQPEIVVQFIRSTTR